MHDVPLQPTNLDNQNGECFATFLNGNFVFIINRKIGIYKSDQGDINKVYRYEREREEGDEKKK
jgi:hypothetical protein